MPKYLFCGGLQCRGHKHILWFVKDFCMENDFIIFDYALLSQDTFTYISDAHNTRFGETILSDPFQCIKQCSIWKC